MNNAQGGTLAAEDSTCWRLHNWFGCARVCTLIMLPEYHTSDTVSHGLRNVGPSPILQPAETTSGVLEYTAVYSVTHIGGLRSIPGTTWATQNLLGMTRGISHIARYGSRKLKTSKQTKRTQQ